MPCSESWPALAVLGFDAKFAGASGRSDLELLEEAQREEALPRLRAAVLERHAHGPRARDDLAARALVPML